VLPQFYLGVAKVFRSYDGAQEAINLFTSIVARNIEELRAAAMYNLASAYIEKYADQSFEDAQKWLEKCLQELRRASSPERKALKLQARALLLFCRIRQELWVKRCDPPTQLETQLEKTAPALEKQLQTLFTDVNEANIPDGAKADVLADYWNNRGLLQEFLAAANTVENRRTGLAKASVEAFRQALVWKVNWIPAKSNMARVYQDLLDDLDSAITCWQEVLQIRPGDNYAEYNLGKLYQNKQDFAVAVGHFEKVTHIIKAKRIAAFLYADKLNRKGDARRIWQEILKEHPDDAEARAALIRLSPTPASGAEPTV
jgi:tetratricopeptide (TPR) repeat protein